MVFVFSWNELDINSFCRFANIPLEVEFELCHLFNIPVAFVDEFRGVVDLIGHVPQAVHVAVDTFVKWFQHSRAQVIVELMQIDNILCG